MFDPVPLAATLSLVLGMAFAAGAAGDPLAAHRWKDRVIVILAPDAGDPRLGEQRALLDGARNGVNERDIVVLEAVGDGPEAAALRRQFADGQGGFRAVLVGKDGGAKLASDRPISAEQLFREIDAMPMRRQELRER